MLGRRNDLGIPQQIDPGKISPLGRHDVTRSPHILPSPEREPWRWLRPSIAVDFVSERHAEWSADRLSDYVKMELVSALEARWNTHVAYARLQQAIFDLVWHCSQTTPLQHVAEDGGGSASEKSAILRQITLLDGRFAESRDRILSILQWLAESRSALGLFCRDFVEVREKKNGRITLTFTNLRNTRKLSCDEVRAQAADYCRYLTDAAEVLRQVGQTLDEQ